MASSDVGHVNVGFVSEPAESTDVQSTASPISEGFTNVSLEETNVKDPENPVKKKKVPRRILHFSDGILEEYSTDEELDDDDEVSDKRAVDPRTLKGLPWIWYWIVTAASNTLYVADTCGEKLAWFFGITTPKYQYAIDEYNKMKAEEEAERIEEERIRKEERELQTLNSTEKDLDNVPEVAVCGERPAETKY